jgi:hypothetical protein
VRGRAAATVETAIALAVALVALLALVVGGLGVSKFQVVAALAREATRYASVHGGQYRQNAGLAVGTSDDWSADIYSDGQARLASGNQIDVRSVGLNPGNLTYSSSWPDGDNWPYTVTSDTGQATGNRVRVTVTYNWVPQFFGGGITLTSTSEMQITN